MEGTARISGSPARSLGLPRRLLAMRSDERLVEILRDGHDAAFEVLYERHASGLLAFCRHMLGSNQDAEDALQQTFVSAYGALLRDDREISLKAWLYTIARNTSLSMLRARRERASETIELPSTVGLADEVERRSELRQLVLGLQDLPDDQRAALVLTELGDLSHAEVAQVLGCEVSAVKGVVFRARSALIERREAWEAECGEIREELAVARGGSLRRGRLRHHLAVCPGCVAYLEEVRRQRALLAVGLPVVPALALKDSIMAAAGVGATSAAGTVAAGGAGVGALASGGGAVAGTSVLGGTLAKVALVGVLVGGAGAATDAVIDNPEQDTGRTPAAEIDKGAPNAPGAPAAAPGSSPEARGAARRAPRERALKRGNRRQGEPRGLARGLEPDRPGLRRGNGAAGGGKPAETGRPAVSPRATPEPSKAPATPPGKAKLRPEVPQRAREPRPAEAAPGRSKQQSAPPDLIEIPLDAP